MNKRKYCIESAIYRKRKILKRKNKALLVSLILLLTITVGGTIAFIYTNTKAVTNTFKPSNVACEVDEEFDGEIKKSVSIRNTGDTEAYIRVAIVVNWICDEDENENTSDVKKVSASKPVLGVDYSLTLSEDDTWIKNGDYYYYKSPVAIGQSTSVLIEECKKLPESTENEGYYLSVEILGEAIQSTPLDAVKGSWNVKINEDGTIAKNGTNSNQEVE